MSNTEKETEFRNYISSLDEKGKANAYVKIKSIPSEEYISDLVSQGMSGMTREDIENVMVQALTVQMGMSEADVRAYTASMSDEEMDIDDAIADCVLPQLRGSLPLGGRLSVNPIITQIGRENNISAEICLSWTAEDVGPYNLNIITSL